MSTTRALKALGNSLRGMTPVNKRRLYISNVLPVLTFGAALWWKPNWDGQKLICDEMQKVQSEAARWITGAFRTTPIGALEISAGLAPIKLSVERLMTKAALRINLLPKHHMSKKAINKELSKQRKQREQKQKVNQRKHLECQTWMYTIAKRSGEKFSPTIDLCHPGTRVIDTHMGNNHSPNRANELYMQAPPKKPTQEFRSFMIKYNSETNDLLMNNEHSKRWVIFTDGGAK